MIRHARRSYSNQARGKEMGRNQGRCTSAEKKLRVVEEER